MTLADTAAELRRLHTAPELLQVVNVVGRRERQGRRRPARDPRDRRRRATRSPRRSATPTASRSPSTSCSTWSGASRPPSTCLSPPTSRPATATPARRSAGRSASASPARTSRIELKPLAESVAAVEAAVAAAEAEGVPFALNARTDAFLRGRDRARDVYVADAIERGRAYLDAGATCVFVPGIFGEDVVIELVAGHRRSSAVSLFGLPDMPAPARLQELGVARLSYGPVQPAGRARCPAGPRDATSTAGACRPATSARSISRAVRESPARRMTRARLAR